MHLFVWSAPGLLQFLASDKDKDAKAPHHRFYVRHQAEILGTETSTMAAWNDESY